MSLTKYWSKRNFKQTAEPRGREHSSGENIFVVQKHHASHLHYDFRLELDGVLKSWAIPKGPSLNPKVKRLAAEVEDHPIEYHDFEGEIAEGGYGAGHVIVWDHGSWVPPKNALEQLEKGHLEFELKGEKLGGKWILIRTKGYGKKPSWLLMKRSDSFARKEDEEEVTVERPESVLTGRTVEDLESGKGPQRQWKSKDKKKSATRQKAKPKENTLPEFVQPQLARLSETPPSGDQWLHEIKFDGYRMLRSPAKAKAKPKKKSEIALTNPDKILYPEKNVTKLQIADFYRSVSKWMLPYVVDRPLAIKRCPNGVDKACFFQKHQESDGHGIMSEKVKSKDRGEIEDIIYIKDVAGLVELVQLGTLEIHVWGSRRENIDLADQIVFDLDPANDVSWSEVKEAAVEIRDFLKQLGLKSFVKMTGGKGLHVHVPIEPIYNWDQVRSFSKAMVAYLEITSRNRYTKTSVIAKRKGKIFIDYLRNAYGATSVAAFSLRAKANAPVAMPISWQELSRIKSPDQFGIEDVRRILKRRKKDPWAGYFRLKQKLRVLDPKVAQWLQNSLEFSSADSVFKKVVQLRLRESNNR